jgi:predicted AAA+ superfamily ATPase
MMLKDTLRMVVAAQRAELEAEPAGVAREAAQAVDLSLPHAVTIAGVRRCGKSTLLRQLLKPDMAYCNFEDPNLVGFVVQDFARLEEVFREMLGDFRVCLLDEIQNVPEWERYVRRSKRKFVLTGSNAALLSRELGTRLTGRHLSLELFPFSYAETLALTGAKPGVESFRAYCQEGGFPEHLRYRRLQVLQELWKDILLRDIAVRHGIRDVQSLQEMALFLLSHVGKEYSQRNLAELFAFGSSHTAAAYIAHMEESYLLFSIPRFALSLKRQRRNPKKIYAIDTGLCRANSVSFSENWGPLLENAVFLALRRRAGAGNVFFFKERRECDFVVRTGNRITAAIQVCAQLTEANLEREVEGLREAMAATACAEGRILTLDQEDRVNDIAIEPAWKWCLARQL